MSDTKRYLLFGDKNLCGFGNQLWSVVGWYFLSKLLDREFILTNTLLGLAFKSPSLHKDFSVPSAASYRSCVPDVDIDLLSIDFFSMDEQFIEGGGCLPMLYSLSQNSFLRSYIDDACAHHPEPYLSHLSQSLLRELFPDLSPEFKKVPLFIDFNLPTDYCVIQFRSFADCGWHGISSLDAFINEFSVVYNQYIKCNEAIVLSDDPGLTAYISHKIKTRFPDLKVLSGGNPRCGHCGNRGSIHSSSEAGRSLGNPLISIKDWLIAGKSNFIYSSGTSFSETCAQYFGVPCYSFDQNLQKSSLDLS